MAFGNLTTDRLMIRRLTESDAPTLSSYRSVPEVARYQSWDEYSVEKALDLIAESASCDPSAKGKWFQFGVALKETGALVGDIGFCNTDGEGKCWIGFTLDRKHWGKGLASEGVAAVIGFYRSLGVEQVWASVDPENRPSINLLRRLGFDLVESLPDDHVFLKRL